MNVLRGQNRLVLGGSLHWIFQFLCFHPRNTNYVILLNHCEEPERFYVQHLIDRFYIDYTTRDIITYRRDYAIKKLKEFEQALSELGDKDEL